MFISETGSEFFRTEKQLIEDNYKKIGNTNFIVSNGYGTWGPPMRLGNRPEILVIDLE